MDVRQRREFYEALHDADAFEDLPGSRRAIVAEFRLRVTATLAASVQA
jgi:hypothetical protein